MNPAPPAAPPQPRPRPVALCPFCGWGAAFIDAPGGARSFGCNAPCCAIKPRTEPRIPNPCARVRAEEDSATVADWNARRPRP